MQSLRTTFGFVFSLGAQKQCCADLGVVFSGSSSFTFLLPVDPGKHLSVVSALLIDTLPRAQMVVESTLFDKKDSQFPTLVSWSDSLAEFSVAAAFSRPMKTPYYLADQVQLPQLGTQDSIFSIQFIRYVSFNLNLPSGRLVFLQPSSNPQPHSTSARLHEYARAYTHTHTHTHTHTFCLYGLRLFTPSGNPFSFSSISQNPTYSSGRR